MTDTHGANSLGVIAEPFVIRIENVHADLESLKGEYMQRCQARREDIKQICIEAKDKGVDPRALKGVIKARALQRKIDGIDDGFDETEAAAYRELAETLGPLGNAAANRAGFAEKDLRPAFMQDTEKAAAHAAGLKTVGRGRGRPKKAKDHPVDALA
jgi:uncharacterized protein (UPF0335 family)